MAAQWRKKNHSKISSKLSKHKIWENKEVLKYTKCLILGSSFFKILNITQLSWQNKYINHCKTLCVFCKNVPTLKSNWNFEYGFSNQGSSLPTMFF